MTRRSPHNRITQPTITQTRRSVRALRDGLVRRADHAVRLGAVHLPEALRQLGRVVLEAGRRPLGKGWQRDLARHRGAVGACAGLGKVLLVVVLAKVEERLVVARRRTLGRDGPEPLGVLERGFIRGLARHDQRLLLVVKPVEAGAVLRAAVVALAHPLRRVVRLPEPPQDVDERNLCRVVDDLHTLGVAGHPRARLIVGGVGGVAGAVADGGGVDAAAGQAPDTLLRAPEAGGDTEAHHQARA
mmetsp:Transcript_37146/g.98498  ORF Transcript_37146/g.98498 Transcript_37146/m.98498 type:complete len:244 (-) Transcript_37146:68-799(-)